MAILSSIPKFVSTENDLVAKKICTMDTGSQITKMGDTVTYKMEVLNYGYIIKYS